MTIGNVVLDTDGMTYKEVDDLIQKLREIRNRKGEARSCKANFDAGIANAKEMDFTFVNVNTGEVLEAKDWVIFDENANRTYDGFCKY